VTRVEIVAYIEERDSSAAGRLNADILATAEQFGERLYLYRPGRSPVRGKPS